MIDNYLQKRETFGGFSDTTEITAAGTTQTVKSTRTATVGLRVQRLRVQVVTGSAGKTWTFAAISGTPALTHALDMSVAGAEYAFDFGPKGVVFPANDPLRVTISAAGAAGRVMIEGYQS